MFRASAIPQIKGHTLFLIFKYLSLSYLDFGIASSFAGHPRLTFARSQSVIPEKAHFVYTFHQVLSAEYKDTKKGRYTIEG
jgi:hypothetical protein